jgi:hypothetical protein
MRIIRDILARNHDPNALAEHRDYRCKASAEEIAEALRGEFREEHLFLLRQSVDLHDAYGAKLAECDHVVEHLLHQVVSQHSAGVQRPPYPDHERSLSVVPRRPNSTFVGPAPVPADRGGPHCHPRSQRTQCAAARRRDRNRHGSLADCRPLRLLDHPCPKLPDNRRESQTISSPCQRPSSCRDLPLSSVAARDQCRVRQVTTGNGGPPPDPSRSIPLSGRGTTAPQVPHESRVLWPHVTMSYPVAGHSPSRVACHGIAIATCRTEH